MAALPISTDGPAGGHRRGHQHGARVRDAAHARDRRAPRARRAAPPDSPRGAGRVEPRRRCSAGALALLVVWVVIDAVAGATQFFRWPSRSSTAAWSLLASAASGIVAAGWYPARRAARIDVDRGAANGVMHWRALTRSRVGIAWRTALVESATLAVDSLRDQPARATPGHHRHRHRHRDRRARGLGARRRAQRRGRSLSRSRHRQRLRLPPDRRSVLAALGARGAAAAARAGLAAEPIAALSDAVRDVGVQVIVPTVVNGRALTVRAGERRERHGPRRGRVGQPLRRGRRRVRRGTSLHRPRGPRWRAGGGPGREPGYGPVWRGPARAGPWDARCSSTASATRSWASWRRGAAGSSARTARTTCMSIPGGNRRGGAIPQAENTVLYIQSRPPADGQRACQAEVILRQLRQLGRGRRQRLQSVDVRTDHRAIRSRERRHRAGHDCAGAREPVHRRHRHRQRDDHQRDRADAGNRGAARRGRDARRGAASSSCSNRPCSPRPAGRRDRSARWRSGRLISVVAPATVAVPPAWVVVAGLRAPSVVTGVVAGYWPARRASGMDPVDALRYE